MILFASDITAEAGTLSNVFSSNRLKALSILAFACRFPDKLNSSLKILIFSNA